MNKVNPVTEQTSNKAINKSIDRVRTNATALNELIHTTGLLVMAHASQYNDVTGAARLIDAMPKSHRRGLMMTWFERYSPIIVESKAGAIKAHQAKDGSAKAKRYDIDGATANPFYAMPEVNVEPDMFTIEDANEAIERIVKRIEKQLKDGHVAEQDIALVTARVAALKAIAKVTPTTGANDEAPAAPAPVVAVADRFHGVLAEVEARSAAIRERIAPPAPPAPAPVVAEPAVKAA